MSFGFGRGSSAAKATQTECSMGILKNGKLESPIIGRAVQNNYSAPLILEPQISNSCIIAFRLW